MANVEDHQGVLNSPEGRTRWEVQGPEILQILINRGGSHDFLTGLSILLKAHGINTESLKGLALNAIVKREGIKNVALIPKVEPKPLDEIARMHIAITVAKVLLANLLQTCINVAVHQAKIEFIGQAIEFAKAFGITFESRAQA